MPQNIKIFKKMKIGTIASGVGTSTTFQLPYLPERLRYIAATQLTGLKVNVLGVGVITDLDANGLTALGRMGWVGDVTNGYQIPMADGYIPNVNVEITVVNSAAVAIDLYVESTNKGGFGYIRNLRQTAFASTPLELKKFSMLGLTNTGATDDLDITFADGYVNKVTIAELPFLAVPYQTNSMTAKVIDNRNGKITSVRFIPAAQQTVYIQDVLLTDAGKTFLINAE